MSQKFDFSAMIRPDSIDGYAWLAAGCQPVNPTSQIAFSGDVTMTQAQYEAMVFAGCNVVVVGTLTVNAVTRPVVL